MMDPTLPPPPGRDPEFASVEAAKTAVVKPPARSLPQLPIPTWIGIGIMTVMAFYLLYQEQFVTAAMALSWVMAQLGFANAQTSVLLTAASGALQAHKAAHSSDKAEVASQAAAQSSHATRADVREILDSPAISGIQPSPVDRQG
jgi:hypothetical protein